MRPQPPLILAKRLIPRLIALDPIAYVGAELEVVCWGPVQLIGEGAEEAVSVA
jgi:hypothetical protein